MSDRKKDSADKFDKLEKTLDTFIENARQLSVLASDFQQGGQTVLNQKLFTLVSGLQELDKCKQNFADVQIPQELLSCIDENKNPQLFTRQCLENTMSRNCELNGKTEVYKKFRSLLMKELSEEFPNEMLHYRARRENKVMDRTGSEFTRDS